MRLKRCSYSRLPHFSAIFTASSAAAAFCCSCSDHTEDCAGPDFFEGESPIRGWLRNASCQLSSLRVRQISSETASNETSFWIGLFEAIFVAQVPDPQQATISRAASSCGNPFQRASTSLTRSSLRQQASRGIRRQDCQPPLRDIERWSEYRRWAESLSPRFVLLHRLLIVRLCFQ